MRYSLCADIMFVGVGEHGPIWPDTDGIMAAIDLAAANGLDGIELFGFENRDLEKIASYGAEKGIVIESLVAKNGQFLGNAACDKELLEGIQESIQAAKALNCRKIVLNAEAFDREAAPEAVTETMIRQLKALAPDAEANDVLLIVEPTTGGFFHKAGDAAAMIRKVDSANVRLLYDIFHFQNMEGNICNNIKENLDVIGDIHAAGGPARGSLAESEIDYRFVLNFVKGLGYDDNVCLEFFTFQGREEKVAESCKYLV